MKKVKKITCPYCGAPAVLRDGKYVYGDRAKGEMLYVCKNYPACDSYVTVHHGTKDTMGTLANAELRNKRIRTHKIFQKLWENHLMTKKEAYRWIEYTFGIPANEAHIAKFSEYRCQLLIDNCIKVLVNNNIEIPSWAA